MATLVEEMIANARTESLIGEIFQSLARDYMDKLMEDGNTMVTADGMVLKQQIQ